jgi:hypothetical protein
MDVETIDSLNRTGFKDAAVIKGALINNQSIILI